MIASDQKNRKAESMRDRCIQRRLVCHVDQQPFEASKHNMQDIAVFERCSVGLVGLTSGRESRNLAWDHDHVAVVDDRPLSRHQ